MGNVNLDLETLPFSKHKWLETSLPNTLISFQDNTVAEFHAVNMLNKRDIELYMLRYLFSKYLVPVLAVLDRRQPGKIIAKDLRGFHEQSGYLVLIEKINYRLPDLGALSYRDGLYMIRQGVQAVACLLPVFHSFLIQEESIGITDAGQCKFWVHSNYFINYVENLLPNPDDRICVQKQIQKSQESCIGSISDVCNPEDSLQEKLHSTQKPFKCANTLKHLIQLIQSKMTYNMGRQEEKIYQQAKQNFFISKDSMTKKRAKDELFSYSMQNAKRWIDSLCLQAQISDDYKISVPCKPYSQTMKTKLTRVKSNAQFFQTGRQKPTYSFTPPLKLTNFKIIAQAKTSLKKCSEPKVDHSNKNYSKNLRSEQKNQVGNSDTRKGKVGQITNLNKSQKRKGNNNSQITIKSALSLQVNCESRQQNISKLELKDKETDSQLPLQMGYRVLQKRDSHKSRDPKLEDEGQYKGGGSNSRGESTLVGTDSQRISTWQGVEFAVRQLRGFNYSHGLGL